MKIDCEQAKIFLLTVRIDEIYSEENKPLMEHINYCAQCKKIFIAVVNSDRLIQKLKKPASFVLEEEFITSSIIKRIEADKVQRKGFVAQIMNYFSLGLARTVIVSILLMIIISFGYLNYQDAGKISELEKNFSGNWDKQMSSAALSKEVEILNYVYNLYRFIAGSEAYLEVNKNWLLLKKEDIIGLLSDYNKLDEKTKKRLFELKTKLLTNIEKDFSLRDKIELQKAIKNIKTN